MAVLAVAGCSRSIIGSAHRFDGTKLVWVCGDDPYPLPSAAPYTDDAPHPVEVYSPVDATLGQGGGGVTPLSLAGQVGVGIPDAWSPEDRSTVQLVACAEFVSAGEEVVETCTFEDTSTVTDRESHSVPLVRASWQITMIETRTGEKRGTSRPFDGEDQDCPPSTISVWGMDSFPSGPFHSVPSSAQIVEYVQPFVEQ
jgi:hypothetical protein